MRSLRKPATQAEVAAHLGVGQKTVSRVFGAPGYVGEVMRARVLEAAQRLGYRPNSGARAIRTGRFNNIILLQSVHGYTSNLPESLLAGLMDGLNEYDISLTLARFPDEALVRDDFLPKTLREFSADGLIVKYDASIPDRFREVIRERRVPAIWVNSRHEHDCVYPDDTQAARDAVTHLLKFGHRRICYMDAAMKWEGARHYSRAARWEGVQAALREVGLTPKLWSPETKIPDDDVSSHMAEFLNDPDRPTAILAYSGLEASMAHRAALEFTGLKVPRDLSLITFASPPLITGITMTVMANPQYEMGLNAAQMMLEKIKHPRRKLSPRILKFQHFKGGSCAAPMHGSGG